MNAVDKKLLLEDLSARLPYGVKVFYKYKTWNLERFATSIRLADGKIALSSKFEKEGDWYPIEEAGEILIKPYLRLMSSMTEEENRDFALLQTKFYVDGFLYPIAAINMINWLNEHHFDYRWLIEKGLAIEVTEENNPYK